MVLTLALAALAEPPAPEPEPAASDDDEPYEIIVYGEMLVEAARRKVVERLEEMGYDEVVIDRGDYVVYRHEAPWYGEVFLYDDGWMQVKRQPLHVEGRKMPWADRNEPLAWAGCLIWPWLCVRTSGATFSQRKWRGLESRTVDELAPDVRLYGDRVADLATGRKVDELPEKLMRLWTEGIPIDSTSPPGTRLQSEAERRDALYRYWESRTETVWGAEVQRAVEGFCRAVVQTSDHPFTEEELARYAAAHPARPFLGKTAEAPEAP